MGFPAVHADVAPAVRRGALHLSTFCQLPDHNAIEALAKTKLDSFILDINARGAAVGDHHRARSNAGGHHRKAALQQREGARGEQAEEQGAAALDVRCVHQSSTPSNRQSMPSHKQCRTSR